LPALTPEEEAAAPDPLRRDLRRVAKLLEQQIARSPEQWVVFEPIWTIEPDQASPGQIEASAAPLQHIS